LTVLFILKPITSIKFSIFIFTYTDPISTLTMSQTILPISFVLIFIFVNFDTITLFFIIFPVSNVLLTCSPSFTLYCTIFISILLFYPIYRLFSSILLSFIIISKNTFTNNFLLDCQWNKIWIRYMRSYLFVITSLVKEYTFHL
jgi:hypothetical protein